MTELARGEISDRPWGRTLGALGTRGLSGELTVTADGRPYRIAFAQGAVVGATSPLASDAAVRIALTGGLLSSTQVADVTRRIATSPHRDEIEVLAEAIRLAPDQAQRLRRRLVAQRAARTFSLEAGTFVIDDQVTVPIVPGNELDVRSIVYLGAKSNLTEQRLAIELEQLGAWFKLTSAGISDLAQFGFTEAEKPVLKPLIEGIDLDALEQQFPDVGERGVRAIVYALAAVGACEADASRRGKRVTRAPESIDATGSGATRTAIPDGISFVTPRSSVAPPSRTQTPSVAPPRTQTPSSAPPSRTQTPSMAPPRTQTPSTAPPTREPSGAYPRMSSPGGSNVRASSPGNPNPRQTGRHPAMSEDSVIEPRTATPTGPAPSRTMTPMATSRTTTTPMATSRTSTDPVISRTVSGNRAKVPSAPPPGTENIARLRAPSGQYAIAQPLATPRPQRGSSPPPMRPRRNTAATIETEALIRDRVSLLDKDADHFLLLGIARDASAEVTRAAYFTLARKLHPDRLASLGIADVQRDAQRLFAQINAAFAVLNDPARRADYLAILGRGGASAVRAEQSQADEMAMKIMHAEEAFKRGEMALRRDSMEQALVEFTTAVELQPNEPEFQALLVWTTFVAAADKAAVAGATRQQLLRAADKLEHSPTARFYLGRVERILGREKEALHHFYEVLKIKPNHSEASSEIRVLEQRLKKR